MLVETHVHTHYSRRDSVPAEGLSSPAEMIDAAIRLGISAIAITDHDVILRHKTAWKAAAKKDIIVIPGEEVSSSDGHIVALGISEHIKPGKSAEETVDIIREQAGVAIAPHPFDIGRHGIKTKARLCDAVEVFNALNLDRLANHRSYKWVTERNLTPVAGSDAHWTEMLGLGTLVFSKRLGTVDEILKAIRKGRHSYRTNYAPLSVTMNWAIKRVQLSHDHVLRYILENYSGPKKHIYKWLLSATKYSPGKIDYLFKALSFVGVGSSVVYSATRGKRIMNM